MGGEGAQPSLLCGQQLLSGPQFHMVVGDTDGGSTHFQDSWITEESGKYKGGVLYPRVDIRSSVRGGV